MVVGLSFSEHRSATNSSIISITLLSLNSPTLDFIGLLISFSVSSIHITWMLKNALFISQLCSSSSSRAVCMYVCMYCSYLSSIHEKAKCIAIFWTGRPHSLGSCHFRDIWATCLPHKGGGVPLSALPKDTTSELSGLFSTTSHEC